MNTKNSSLPLGRDPAGSALPMEHGQSAAVSRQHLAVEGTLLEESSFLPNIAGPAALLSMPLGSPHSQASASDPSLGRMLGGLGQEASDLQARCTAHSPTTMAAQQLDICLPQGPRPSSPLRRQRILASMQPSVPQGSFDWRWYQTAAFCDLGDSSLQISTLCMRPELCSIKCLQSANNQVYDFASLPEQEWSATIWGGSTDAVIVLTLEDDLGKVLEFCGVLEPTIVAILAFPELRAQAKIAQQLLLNKAADVVFLSPNHVLTDLMLGMACTRQNQIYDRVQSEVQAEVKAEVVAAVKDAQFRLLWSLPHSTYLHVPPIDTSLKESCHCIGDLVVEKKLGSGTCGTVYKAHDAKRGIVAVKVIKKINIKGASHLSGLDREFGIMLHLDRHPNVASAFHVLHSTKYLALVMTFSGEQTLDAYVEANGGRLGNDAVERFCKQEAGGVAHLHQMKVCHRDLKPANAIVSDDGETLQIVDFGLAIPALGYGMRLKGSCGTFPFCAPEVFGSEERAHPGYSGFAADVWSLAVNFVELAHGNFSIERMLGWRSRAKRSFSQKAEDLKNLPGIVASLQWDENHKIEHVVSHMLQLSPEDRPLMPWVVSPEAF